jgi:hypothetical protein
VTSVIEIESNHSENICSGSNEYGKSVGEPQVASIESVSIDGDNFLGHNCRIGAYIRQLRFSMLKIKVIYLRSEFVKKLIVILKDKSSMRKGRVWFFASALS